jgi:hypothetical protein
MNAQSAPCVMNIWFKMKMLVLVEAVTPLPAKICILPTIPFLYKSQKTTANFQDFQLRSMNCDLMI